ncbi:MAG: HIT family protein, partial [Sphingomicrobium sp.]
MVDPNVHFHVFPRYSGERQWDGLTFADQGWPGPPDLKSATALTADQINRLRDDLQNRFG